MSITDLAARFLSDGSPIHVGTTEVTPLVDGIDFLRHLHEAIARTGKPGDLIHLLAWRFDPTLDLLGRPPESPKHEPLGALLAAKAAAGVDVRLILDGSRLFSNFPPPGLTFLPRIAGHRDNALAANALRRLQVPGHISPPLSGRVLIDWSGAFFGSHHQKATLVATASDAVAFVGGIDFWGNRLDRAPHDRLRDANGKRSGWHDLGVMMRGEAVDEVWANFASRWHEAVTLPQNTYFWVRRGSGVGREPFIRAEGEPAPLPFRRAWPSRQAVQVLRSRFPRKIHRLRGRMWTYPPHGGIHEIFQTMTRAIGQASRYIYVEDQFLGDNPFRHEAFSLFPHLRDAAGRGVKLILVTSGKTRPDRSSSDDVNTKINNDVKRYVLDQLPPWDHVNIAVYRVASLTVHSKVVLIDDVFAMIGSANLQSRSMDGQDFELSVGVVDTGTWVRDLRVRLWAEHLRLASLESSVRGALEDLSLALGIWRIEWKPAEALPGLWQRDGSPPGFHPTERVLGFVGPPDKQAPSAPATLVGPNE